MAGESATFLCLQVKPHTLSAKKRKRLFRFCAIWQQPTTESTVEPGSNKKNKGTMTKGYADYVIAMALEIDREIKRELEGVEMPLFRQKYEEWLKAQGLAESSRVNYMRWLHKADSWIFDSDHDFGRFSTKPGTHQTSEPPKLSAKSTKTFSLKKRNMQKKKAKRNGANPPQRSATGSAPSANSSYSTMNKWKTPRQTRRRLQK